jgi:hypothetical protein
VTKDEYSNVLRDIYLEVNKANYDIKISNIKKEMKNR